MNKKLYTIDCTTQKKEGAYGGVTVIKKNSLHTLYVSEDKVQYFEGCELVGYRPDGDSFIFSQGSMFDGEKERRTMFCMSRIFLEKTLERYKDCKDDIKIK